MFELKIRLKIDISIEFSNYGTKKTKKMSNIHLDMKFIEHWLKIEKFNKQSYHHIREKNFFFKEKDTKIY